MRLMASPVGVEIAGSGSNTEPVNTRYSGFRRRVEDLAVSLPFRLKLEATRID